MAVSTHFVRPWARREDIEWTAAILYTVRCAVAGLIAFEVARLSVLDRPVWAVVSALVVSQETESDTMNAIGGRCLGTLIGALVAIAVNLVGGLLQIITSIELAVATAICAIITVKRPQVRVAVWTCAIVLITAGEEASPLHAAANRALEVLIGALVGGAIAVALRELRAAVGGRKP